MQGCDHGAGVEIARDDGCGGDGDGLADHPQMGIDRIPHRVGRPVFPQVDMGHLTCGVHAGIGAAGAANGNGFAAKTKDGGFDGGLLLREPLRQAVTQALTSAGGQVTDFNFDLAGLQTWRSRCP